MSEYTGQDNGTLRVTIGEAASRLGVTEAAIRKRIQRGSLHKEMGEDGRVYVYLDLYQDMSHPKSQVDHEALVRNCGIASASWSVSWTVGASRPRGTSTSSRGWPRQTRISRTG